MKIIKADKVKSCETEVRENDIEIFIKNNPDILGIDGLSIIDTQVNYSDSILDMLGYSEETNTHYEIEIMLGKIDSKHISHCLGYWAKEKTKNPLTNHCAVLVCESSTGRYSDLLKILPAYLPLIVFEFSIIKSDGGFLFTCDPVYYNKSEHDKYFITQDNKNNRIASLSSKKAIIFLARILIDNSLIYKTYRDISSETGISLGNITFFMYSLSDLNLISKNREIEDIQKIKDYLLHVLSTSNDKKEYLINDIGKDNFKLIT